MKDPPEVRHVLLTGAAQGIGYATARRLLSAGHRVTITSRVSSRAKAAAEDLRQETGNDKVGSEQLELNSFAEIRKCAERLLTRQPFHVVVHNAGIIIASPERTVTADGLEACLQCHAVGPMLLTALLAPGLSRPSRLIAVSSGLHAPNTRGEAVGFDVDDPNLSRTYHRDRAYKNAKLAQLWFVLEWERRFGAAGFHADAVCPGFVPGTAARHARGFERFLLAVVLPRMPFATTLERAAQIEADWCLQGLDTPGGRYFNGREVAPPSEEARDRHKAGVFWQMVEDWTGQPIKP